MKYAWSTILLLFPVIVCGSASADDFDDFRIPAHRRTDWSASLGFDGRSSSHGLPDRVDRSRTFSGGGSTAFSWLGDSDPSMTRIGLSAGGSGNGFWRSARFTPPTLVLLADDEARNALEHASVVLEHRRYPWARPVGVAVRLNGYVNDEQEWEKNRTDNFQEGFGGLVRDVTHQSIQQWRYASAISSEIAIGVGRVRDATTIYETRTLERRLQEAGALTRALSPEARHKLAALLDVRFDYEQFRERGAKDIWKEIETILEEDGALGEGGLDAYAILRAGERHLGAGLQHDDVPSSPFLRQVGFFVGPLLADQHSHVVSRFDNNFSRQQFVNDTLLSSSGSDSHFHERLSSDDVLAGLLAEYHRPLALSWQFDLIGRLLFPIHENTEGALLNTSTQISWMMADRWEASAYAHQDRSLLKRSEDRIERDTWAWQYGVSARYYVQDRLALSVGISEDQFHQGVGPVSIPPSRAAGPAASLWV